MTRIKWTDDELALTLYIYLNCTPNQLSKTSEFLIDFRNRLEEYTQKNRSINSIDLRIANYKAIDPNYRGAGLSGGGRDVVRIWNYYQTRFDELKEKYDDFMRSTNSVTLEEAKKEINNEAKISFDEMKSISKDAYFKHLVNQRNGTLQKMFKGNLMKEFNSCCPLCGINNKQLLIASHIVPYSKCNDIKDMVNHENGLLLCPNHDSLFDKGLITFTEKGKIEISEKIDTSLYEALNLTKDYYLPEKYLTDIRVNNFIYHKNNIFVDNKKK